jgi:hypothetical protein
MTSPKSALSLNPSRPNNPLTSEGTGSGRSKSLSILSTAWRRVSIHFSGPYLMIGSWY